MTRLKFNSTSDLITTLFNKYKHRMQRIAFSILKDSQYAEDVVSEVMIKIIKNINMIENVDGKNVRILYIQSQKIQLWIFIEKNREKLNGMT